MRRWRLLRCCRVLRVKPGDVIVFEYTGSLINDEQMQGFLKHLKSLFPNNEVVAIAGGLLLTIHSETST